MKTQARRTAIAALTLLLSGTGAASASEFHGASLAVQDMHTQALFSAFNSIDRIERHLSDSDYANAQPHHRTPDSASWVDVNANSAKQNRFSATAKSGKSVKGKSKLKAKGMGLAFGMDFPYDRVNRFGLALHYDKADLSGSTKGDSEQYGLTAYGMRDIGRIRVMGQAGLLKIKGKGKPSGWSGERTRAQTQVFSLGLRVEAVLPVYWFDLTPHAGIQLVHSRYDTASYPDGTSVKAKRTSVMRAPLGIKVQTYYRTDGGLGIQPSADISVAPQFGKKKTTAEAGGESLHYAVAGSSVTRLDVGLKVKSRWHSAGLFYSGEKGSESRAAHAISVKYKYTF